MLMKIYSTDWGIQLLKALRIVETGAPSSSITRKQVKLLLLQPKTGVACYDLQPKTGVCPSEMWHRSSKKGDDLDLRCVPDIEMQYELPDAAYDLSTRAPLQIV